MKRPFRSLSQEVLNKNFTYNAGTGVITNRLDRSTRAKAGSEAGSVYPTGYRVLQVGLIKYKAHRVAWAMHHGCWPDGEIDHINGNKSDNRICNLRCVSRCENAQNFPALKNNKSGVKGVSWCNSRKQWVVIIQAHGKRKYLGRFINKGEATAAYQHAAEHLHGEFRRTA